MYFFQALPFALENLLELEIEQITRLMESHPGVACQYPDGLADLCPKFCLIMEDFVMVF